ncbi:MAG: class I SAM-dependent methyltransferase [Anaerolineae bacterium]|nr:class I SAM-dependent methyltransferase [Anaerolineae bacterium]
MSTLRQRALTAFYENLAHVQQDIDYYLNPIGLSRRETIVSLVTARAGETVIDLGCGDGLIAVKLQEGDRRVLGCDLSWTRARRARQSGIAALCADVLALPYRGESFDWAICSEVIEHVTDPRLAMTEIWRVLRPGGAAILTVPLDEHLEQTLLDVPEETLASGQYQEIKAHFDLKGSHLSCFTAESFRHLVRVSGFAIEATAYTYNHTLTRPLLWRAAKRLYRALAGRRPTAPFSRWVESLVRPLIALSYRREDSPHHIVVRARKARAVAC